MDVVVTKVFEKGYYRVCCPTIIPCLPPCTRPRPSRAPFLNAESWFSRKHTLVPNGRRYGGRSSGTGILSVPHDSDATEEENTEPHLVSSAPAFGHRSIEPIPNLDRRTHGIGQCCCPLAGNNPSVPPQARCVRLVGHSEVEAARDRIGNDKSAYGHPSSGWRVIQEQSGNDERVVGKRWATSQDYPLGAVPVGGINGSRTRAGTRQPPVPPIRSTRADRRSAIAPGRQTSPGDAGSAHRATPTTPGLRAE